MFAHNKFIGDLMDDWSKAQPPYDVTKFVPYDFMFDVEFTEVEVLLPVNSYNWVDNSSKTKRNGLTYYKLLKYNETLSDLLSKTKITISNLVK